VHLESIFRTSFARASIGQVSELQGFDRIALSAEVGKFPSDLRTEDISATALTQFLESDAGLRLRNNLQSVFSTSRDFTTCRSEFFPDAGGRGFESPVSAQTRCLARLHLGSENEPEPTGFTATRPIAGGSFSAAIRVIVPAVLALGTTLVAGGIAGGAIGRVTQTRPSSVVPLQPVPQPGQQPFQMGQVFEFIRRNGIFLALGLALFAFFRR